MKTWTQDVSDEENMESSCRHSLVVTEATCHYTQVLPQSFLAEVTVTELTETPQEFLYPLINVTTTNLDEGVFPIENIDLADVADKILKNSLSPDCWRE
ncbi:hypothetical protein BgiBS90_032786 [Biomphalaria glabrata]|nr:hypothetical protein BgiBS90_032786 [Biomphalaria glabrata]